MLRLLLALALTSTDSPFLPIDFEAAHTKAKKENKALFIDFFATWCEPCKVLDKTTWKDASVANWLSEKTVPIKLDAEIETELATKYGIGYYPTMLFVDAEGNEIGRIVGYVEAVDFLKQAPNRLSGVTRIDELRGLVKEAPDDLGLQMSLATELIRAGLHDEALEIYLHFFDERPDESGLVDEHAAFEYANLRRTYYLEDIYELGQAYPPAIKALEERAEALGRALFNGGGEIEAGDMVALNNKLGRETHTLAIYDQLRSVKTTSPQLLESLYEGIVELLLKNKRYEDVIADGGPRMRDIEKSMQMFELTKNSFSEKDQKQFRAWTANDASAFFHAYLGTKQLEDARRIATRILNFDSSIDTFRTLVTLARQMEQAEIASELMTRAREVLSEQDIADLKAD